MRPLPLRVPLLLACSALALGAPSLPAQGFDLQPGDILVTDYPRFFSPGSVRRIRADRTIETLFSGSPLHSPADVAIDRDGSLLVSSFRAVGSSDNAVFRLDPATGQLTRLNVDTLQDNYQVMRDTEGGLVVSDGNRGIVRLDEQGFVTVVSPVTVPWDEDIGLALDYDGSWFVAQAPAPFAGNPDFGYLYSVDPATGLRTEIVHSADLLYPNGISLERDGSLLVVDSNSTTGVPERRELKRVARDGTVTRADLGGMVQPKDVAAAAMGYAVITDRDGGAVVGMAPSGNLFELVSEGSDGDPNNGLPVDEPYGVTIVPFLWLVTPDTVTPGEIASVEIRALRRWAGRQIVFAMSEEQVATPLDVWWSGSPQTSSVDLLAPLAILTAALDAQGEATLSVPIPNDPALVGKALHLQAFLPYEQDVSNYVALPVR